MTIKEFEKLFSPTCRTLFNFKRAKDEKWKIKQTIISDRDTLGDLLLPWGEGEFFKDYKRLTVKEAGLCHKEVLQLAASLASENKKSTWVLPAYKFGKSKILLDGCHRTCALWLAGTEFTILLCTVDGPQDERGLWDFAA